MKFGIEKFPGKLENLNRFFTRLKLPLRLTFFVMGIASTIWFLIRVIPKPSRATYPCMQAAAPVMSGFILWLVSLSASALAIKKAKSWYRRAKLLPAIGFLVVAFFFSLMAILQSNKRSSANPITYQTDYEANDPYGEGQGIFPGRVVWAWDSDATNENQTRYENGDGYINESDDYYFLKKNNNQTVIDSMFADVIRNLGGKAGIGSSWDALFRYHNKKKTGIENPYTPGEIIFIKINATSILTDGGESWTTWMTDSIKKYKPNWWNEPDVVETTPQVVLSVIRQLINEAGVEQEDIFIGDPLKNVYQHLFDMWKSEFPNINVLGNDIFYKDIKLNQSLNLSATGRIPVVPSTNDLIFYSDKGSVMDEAISDKLYTIHQDADYLINIASLKAHACAGITLCTKNHFGSHTRSSASHLHKGLIGKENDTPYRTSYGLYRVHVDIMGHELLGGNTMLFLVDGLYSAEEGWTEAQPVKWRMVPFNNDYTNSLFASQDPVALESVCFDFLRNEYDGTGGRTNRPNFGGVDDYLHQAADSSNWPEGITYDPENDNSPIGSLGTHEHWNSPDKKQYSRNLGKDYGIELFAPGLVNNLPVAAKKIGLVKIHKNSKPVFLTDNLNDLFMDPDGDVLTFSVTPANNDEVDAMMAADTAIIIISGNNFTGTNEITIHVYDGTDTLNEMVTINVIEETFMSAVKTNETIIYDGIANEQTWNNSAWFYIDQVWMPYRAEMTAEDFTGRYKIAWSENENMIFFFAETYDDAFVDGYVYNSDPAAGGGYPNYDILEIFIDENKSGGLHVFDDGNDWGTNGENAFSYHIAVDQPDDGNTVSDFIVCDIAGISWSNYYIPDYADHFQDFIVRREGHKLTWEFSLKVFNDTYDDSTPENSRVTLALGKQLGLSLAYCDNDNPDENPKTRDNFIGSDIGPDQVLSEWNEHWKDAGVYGTLKLDDDQPNRSPIIQGSIDDLSIFENNIPYTVCDNLKDVFSDPDEDQLVFTAMTDAVALTIEIKDDTVLVITAGDGFSGTTTVTVKANDGEYSVSTQFTITSTVDVSESDNMEEYIMIWPNPAASDLRILMYNKMYGEIEINIIDMSGRMVNSYKVFKYDQTFDYIINIDNLDHGIYMVQLIQGNRVITKYLIH